MAEEEKEKKQEENAEEEEEGLSEEERQAILEDFEARIEAGDFGGRPFHNVVREEIYPLLGEEALSAEEFSRLVRKWARQNYPKNWPVRSYQEE